MLFFHNTFQNNDVSWAYRLATTVSPSISSSGIAENGFSLVIPFSLHTKADRVSPLLWQNFVSSPKPENFRLKVIRRASEEYDLSTNDITKNEKLNAIASPNTPAKAALYLILLMEEDDDATSHHLGNRMLPSALIKVARVAREDSEIWAVLSLLARSVTHTEELFLSFANSTQWTIQDAIWAIHAGCCTTCSQLDLRLALTERKSRENIQRIADGRFLNISQNDDGDDDK